MKRVVLVTSFLAGCLGTTEPDPVETGEVESAGTPLAPQGAIGQGTTMQGTTMQGTTMQGTTMQGTTMQGGTHGGVSIVEGSVDGTALIIWKKIYRLKAYTWEKRTPTSLCKYNQARTALLEPCTKTTLASSPLIGATFPTTFTKPGPSGTVQYITVTARIEAVRQDPTVALFNLLGSDYALPYTFVACDDWPRLCRQNKDIFNYDVKVIDVVDDSGGNPWLCPTGQTALALAGYWDVNGVYAQSAPGFTFACTNGVIAKCTRWGYRPYDRAIRANDPNSVLVPLRGYHQTCIRAAMASYCGTGHSFTKNGTLIDLSDYDSDGLGFIPPTTNVLASPGPITAFAHEGHFDQHGATFIDNIRYPDLVSAPEWNPNSVCPGRFYEGEFYKYTRRTNIVPSLGPFMVVSSAPACAHSELKVGKVLHHECSQCTHLIQGHCTDPFSPLGWDQACVDAVRNNATCMASETNRMALHSECEVGPALQQYDTGCTLRVCSTPGYGGCCGTGGSWTQACVDQADSVCTGAGERRPAWGFCSSGSIFPEDPLPPLNN